MSTSSQQQPQQQQEEIEEIVEQVEEQLRQQVQPVVALELLEDMDFAAMMHAINILTLVLLIGTVVVAVLRQPGLGEVVAAHPTFVDPALSLFIPSLVLLGALFLGFVGFGQGQWNDETDLQQAVNYGVGYWFMLSNFCACMWVVLWIKELFIPGTIMILLYLFCISFIHRNLMTKFPLTRISRVNLRRSFLFLHTPFSMAAALAWVIALQSWFVAVEAGHDDALHAILACVGVWLLGLNAAIWIVKGLWPGGMRDGVFAATIAWVLIAIAVNQRDAPYYLDVQAGVIAACLIIGIGIAWYLGGGALSAKLRGNILPTNIPRVPENARRHEHDQRVPLLADIEE